MTVSKRTRYEVLRRDGHTCRYCGGCAPDVELTVDHVVPTALGGSDDPSNLVAACRDCNAGKAASNPDAPLVAQVADDAIRWAQAMRSATDGWLAAREQSQAYRDAVAERWDNENDIYRWGRARIPDDWETTVEKWCSVGLPVELVSDAIATSMRRRVVSGADVWRYTCGIVWAKLTELQEQAQSLTTPPAAGDAPACGGHPSCECEAIAYERGWLEAVERANHRYSYLQFEALARVSDADGMAWAADH